MPMIDCLPCQNSNLLRIQANSVGRGAVVLSMGESVIRLDAEAVGQLRSLSRCAACGELLTDGYCLECPIPLVVELPKRSRRRAA